MSFNTVALHNYPLVIPVLRSEPSEPFRLRRGRASTPAQGIDSQARRDTSGIPRLDATNIAFGRECPCIWKDAEVRNVRALTAKSRGMSHLSPIHNMLSQSNGVAAESACRLQGERTQSHKPRARDRKHRKRVTFAEEPRRDGRPRADRTQECRTSTGREQGQRVPSERGHDSRLPVQHKRDQGTSGRRHHRYESVPNKAVRPPVSAISSKPPAQGRHPRRLSFEQANIRVCPHGYHYPIYILPPPVVVRQVHVSSPRRDRISVDADRRVPFPSTDAPQLEKSTEVSGLTRFNPFNMLRTMFASTAQKKQKPEPPKVHTNRLHRKSSADRV